MNALNNELKLNDLDLDYALFGGSPDIAIDLEDIEQHLYIVDKRDTLIPYVPNRMQRDLAGKLTGRDLILKYRQGGASTFFVARYFKKAVTGRARIAIMAHDSPTTQKLRRMAETFWRNLPDNLRPARGLDNAETTTYRNTDSEITIATAGSKNIGLGGTYGGGVHGSEVAYWRDPAITMSAIMQGVPLHAPIALESAPHGASGWFYEHCMEALRGEGIWTLHFYQWWWEDDYAIALEPDEYLSYTDAEQTLVNAHALSPEQIKWRRYKVRELGSQFPESYPEDIMSCFLSSGGGVFNLQPFNLIHFPPDTLEDEISLPYEDGGIYVGGLDWGQEDDFSSLSLMQLRTGQPTREVYVNRWNKQSWASIRGHILEQLTRYHVEKLIPERNSIGSVNIENLATEIEQEGLSIAIQSFYTDQRSKDMIVKGFQVGLTEYGLLLLPVKYANAELTSYISKQSPMTKLYSYEAAAGGHDDTVIARLLAYFAASQLWI